MKIDIQALKLITIAKDIITGLSALTAAIVAILGLKAWRTQLKGKTEYDLAKRFLWSVYQVRDAIARVRNPFQSSGEISQAMKEANIEGNLITDDKANAQSQALVYDRRWLKVKEAYIELESISLEAETLWGQDINELLSELRLCSSRLITSINRHLRRLDSPKRKINPQEMERIDDIIYGFPGDTDKNNFSQQIEAAVNQVEDFIRPHLKL